MRILILSVSNLVLSMLVAWLAHRVRLLEKGQDAHSDDLICTFGCLEELSKVERMPPRWQLALEQIVEAPSLDTREPMPKSWALLKKDPKGQKP